MMASTAFYSTIRGVQDLTEKVIELDTALVGLERVADADQFEFNTIIERAIDNVSELSGKTSEYLELLNEFSRQGNTLTEALDLTDTTTMLLNVSDLSAKESMDALTASMINFGIAAEDSARVADKLNEVDNNYAITTRDLALSLNKSASTAKTFSVELDTLLGYTTAIGTATRESGNIIGNSLKTIMARITTNDSSISALEGIGISMNKASGEAKNAEELISELAGRWDGLSDAQRRNTAVGVAGIYQLSRFNALMNNYQMGMDAATTASNSFGSAMREQEKYNQSLEARINRLQTAWYGLADSLGNTIIYDGLVVGTKTLEVLTGAMSSTTSAGTGLGVVFGGLGTVALLTSTRFRTWSASMVQATASAVANRTANTALASSLGAVATTAAGATTAMRTFMAATGIGIAIVGITTAFTALTGVISRNIQEQEEFDVYMQKNTDAITVNKEKVDELISSYTGLSNAKENGKLSTEQEEKLVEVQNQLAELYPALVNHVDASGNAHLKAASMIDAETEAVRKLVEEQKNVDRESAEDTFSDVLKDLEKANAERNRLAENLDKTRSKRSTKDVAELELHLARLDKDIVDKTAEISNSVLDIADAFTDVGEKIDDTINTQIRDALSGLDFSELDSSELKEFAKEIADIRIALNDALSSGDESGFNKAREELNSLINSVGVSKDEINSTTLNFDKMSESAKQMGASLESADDSMDGLADSTEGVSESIADLIEDISELKTVQEQLAGVSTAHTESSQELLFMYEQLTMRMNGLTDAELQSLLKKQQLTAEEKLVVQAMQQRGDVISQLNVLYPQWAVLQGEAISLSQQQVEAMKQEERANKVLLEAYGLASQGKLSAEQQMTVNQAAGTKARIDNIKAEIAALNVLQQEAQKAYDEITKSKNLATDDDAGRGAMRAGYLVGKAQSATVRATSDLSSLQSQLNGLIDSVDATVKSVNTSTSASKKSSSATKDSAKSTKESIYITDKYKQQIEELNLAIEKQNKLQSQYPNHTAKYRSALEGELKLQQQKLDLINSQTKALEAQIKSGKIAQTGSVSDPKSATTTVSKSSTVKSGGAWTGRLTSAQGNRVLGGKSEYHRGIDIASPKGTALIANYAGKIIASGLAGKKGGGAENYHSSYGNIVVVQDDNGNKHLYAHLEKAIAKLGTTIEKGAQIGNIGSTGRSTGSHLHYEVTNNGKILDAASFAKEARAGSLAITQQVNETVKAVDNTQQSIDDAKSTLLSLQGDALAQQEKIAQLQDAIRESTLAEFDYKRNNFDSNLSHEVAKLKTLDKESVRYNKTLDLMTRYMDQKQKVNRDELNYLNDLIAKGGLSEIAMSELIARKLELKTAIHDLNNEIQNFKLDNLTNQFENAIDDNNDAIAIQEARMHHFDTSSKRYTESLKNIRKGYRDNVQETWQYINSLQNLINTQQVTGDNLDATKDKINDLMVELENLHVQIREKNYEILINIKTQYDEDIDNLQFEIDRSKAIQGMYEEGTANYNKELEKQIDLTKQQMKMYDQSRRELQKEMFQSDISIERKKELKEQLEDLSLSYVNAEASIRSMTKALEDSNKAMLESIADKYIEAYKEYVREISEEHMKLLDVRAEAEQEAYEKRKKLLEDELDLFRKNVEEKLRLIRREEDARTYQKDLDEMEKNRNEIQRKINLLSIDNSYEAKKKREALIKELDEIDEEIAEHKHQRDIELQEQALNDLLEQKEEEFEIHHEHNDKVYDDTVRRLDAEREYWQLYYRDLENDERKFAKIREDILAGHFDKVNKEFEDMIDRLKDTMPDLLNTMEGTMEGVGDTIRQNVIDQLEDAMELAEEFMDMMDEMASINFDNAFSDNFDPNADRGSSFGDNPDDNFGITEENGVIYDNTFGSEPPSYNDDNRNNVLRHDGDTRVLVAKYLTDILAQKEESPVRAKNIRDKAHQLAATGRSQGSDISVNSHLDNYLDQLTDDDKKQIKRFVNNNIDNILITDYLQDDVKSWAASLDTGGYLNFKSSSGGIDGKGGKAIIAHDGEVMLNKVQTDRLLDNIEVSDGLLNKITSMASMFSNIVSGMSPTLSANSGYGDITVNFGDVHNATQQQAENFASQFINRINVIKGGF